MNIKRQANLCFKNSFTSISSAPESQQMKRQGSLEEINPHQPRHSRGGAHILNRKLMMNFP